MTLVQVQSVIQPNQQSVIQTATNIQPVAISKGNVILVSKPNSVIQTAQGSLQTLQVSHAHQLFIMLQFKNISSDRIWIFVITCKCATRSYTYITYIHLYIINNLLYIYINNKLFK